MISPEFLLKTLRQHDRLPAAQLLAELQVSRPTLMRTVRASGDTVLTIGRSRRTSYAARRLLRGSGAALPLFRVDVAGGAEQVAQLHLAQHEGCVLEFSQSLEWPLDAEMRDGWFDGIPYPLQDLRPEGFLGRAFAREHAALLQVSDDPRVWSDDDTLYALSLLGVDLPGNYILGETACRLWLERLQRPLTGVTGKQIARVYPALALQAMRGSIVGSCAGGEFPKFTAVRDINGELVHVIVKFSGSDDSRGTARWADLLVCEQLASECVSTLSGLTGAHSTVHTIGGRRFLEVVRFDRHGPHGRSALCSWGTFSSAWFGLRGRPWSEAAVRLFEGGFIDAESRDAMTRLWHFGQLIANTDMHDGNLSFVPGAHGLSLAPVYDMLPMLYAPQRGVELPERNFEPRLPMPAERELWQQSAMAAMEFWKRASGDRRISAGFRSICARNAQTVAACTSLGATAPR